TTSALHSTRRSTRCEPMKLAPPVTRTERPSYARSNASGSHPVPTVEAPRGIVRESTRTPSHVKRQRLPHRPRAEPPPYTAPCSFRDRVARDRPRSSLAPLEHTDQAGAAAPRHGSD